MARQFADLRELITYLERKLGEYAQTDHGWQVEIHGKGKSVQVKTSEIVQFSAQRAKPLEERR